MKKAILITLAALGLAGMAQADYSVTLDDSYYQGLGSGNASWVYVWTGKAGDGSAINGNNWGYLQNKNQQSLSTSSSQTPVNYDPAFIGFDFDYTTSGQQVLTANNNKIVVTAPTWMGNPNKTGEDRELCKVFLGNNVTFQGSNNGFPAAAP